MDAELLTYVSLQVVLQYTEVNLRFQLSAQIPSIRTTERSIPLKINILEFNGRKTVVNKTEYQLGVYRKYHDNNAHVPNDVQYTNDNGGASYDFDKYGLRDFFANDIITPGDVIIEEQPRQVRLMALRRTNEGEMQYLERQLEQFEQNVAEARLQGKEFVETNNHGLRNGAEGAAELIGVEIYEGLPNQQNAVYPLGTPVAGVESLIKNIRAQLVPYHCCRDNCSPPFDMFTQLTIKSTNGKQIQRVHYNKKLHEAQKELNSFLFGNRRYPIQVGCFNFEGSWTLRLPLGLRLKIESMQIRNEVAKIYEALQPILEASSFPLNSLTYIALEHDDKDLGHAIVKSAKKLVVCCRVIIPWHTILQSLSNQRVHLKIKYFENEEFVLLVQNWLNTGRRIDTYFSFQFGEQGEETITALFELIKQRFNRAIPGERSVTLRMNQFLDIKIFYEASSHAVDDNESEWILKMKVIRHEAN